MIDIYIPDMKYCSDEYAVAYSSAENYFQIAKAAIAEMVRQVGAPVFDDNGIMQKGVIVRHLMLPGLLFDSKKILDYLYDTYRDDIYISLMSQYTPPKHRCKAKKLNGKLSKKHYEAMVDYCVEKGIKNAFIQDVSSSGEEYIPEFICEN